MVLFRDTLHFVVIAPENEANRAQEPEKCQGVVTSYLYSSGSLSGVLVKEFRGTHT